MKSLFQLLFVIASVASLSLSCTLSYANASAAAEDHFIQIIQIHAFPDLKGEGNKKIINTVTKNFGMILNKPLIMIPLNGAIQSKAKEKTSKNNFFEVTTLLNDKLQYFIAELKKS